MAEIKLAIEGMHCGACVRRVTQALSALDGVQVEEVVLGKARITSAETTAANAAIEALAKIGFTARADG
jgi:copper chaperone CopZ